MENQDLEEIEKNLASTRETGNKYLQAVLIRFSVRWAITIALYVFLWNKFTWLKWTLFLVAPLGIFNLYQIFKQKNNLVNKVREIENLLTEIKTLER